MRTKKVALKISKSEALNKKETEVSGNMPLPP